MNVPTNSSGRRRSAVSSPSTSANLLPSGRPPDASIGVPPSAVRRRPTASNFSSESPTGSIRLWHAAQTGLLRCSASRSRTDSLPSTVLSFSAGTSGSGGGGGTPSRLSSTHLPRRTGEVRVAYDVTVRMLP